MHTVVIGRSEDADYSIAHDAISRRHCRLTFEGEEVWVEDLGSSNGTVLNGTRLEAGERVRMGSSAEVVLAGEVVLDRAFLRDLRASQQRQSASSAAGSSGWDVSLDAGQITRTATRPVALGGIGAALCAIGLLVYYLTFTIPAQNHDQAFQNLQARYQNQAQTVTRSQASIETVAQFLPRAKAIFTTAKDSLYPRYEKLVASKDFVRALSARPAVTKKDYRALFEQIRTDLRGLIHPLNKALKDRRRDFRTAVTSGEYSSVDELQSALEKYLVSLREAQRVRQALQPYKKPKNEDAFHTAKTHIEKGLDRADTTRALLTDVVEAKRRYQQKIKSGLQIAETANEKLSKLGSFPHSSTIREVYRHWDRAYDRVTEARQVAKDTKRYKSDFKATAAGHLLADDLKRISKVRTRINNHRSSLKSKYLAAKKAESTLLGSAGRALGRAAEDLAQMGQEAAKAVSNSRLGQELDFGIKSLILGTKVLFDLANIDEGTDVLGMAQRYQDELEQLAEESRQVRRMEGPSVTDLSSFTEALVEGAHEETFQ